MRNIPYDMDKLNKIVGLDAENAVKNFASRKEYFEQLDSFLEKSAERLQTYMPTVVIYSDTVKGDFMAEVDETKQWLNSLGISRMDKKLTALRNEAIDGSEKILSDNILFLNSEIKILIEELMAAKMPDYATEEEDSKPVILAVDDMPELLSSIVNMTKEDYAIMAVTSGDAALKALEKQTPSIFLLDIEMPRMDGYALASIIRQQARFASIPIIFLTAKGTRGHVVEALKRGGNDYIVKPVNKDILLKKLRHHLGSKNK